MISIIVPIFNAEKYLNECLESISQQSYGDFEAILIDDGSTDNSLNICKAWGDVDKRFKFFSVPNGGVSYARNIGLEKVKGDYICFIDSDDIVAHDYLAHLDELSANGYFGVSGYCRDEMKLGKGNKRITQYKARDFIIHILNESIDHPNICMMLFKSNIIKDAGLKFTLGCVRNEDTEFYIKYLSYEEYVKVSSYPAYYYRLNPLSAMGAPITKKSLSSIEASRRMNQYLVEKGIISDNSIIYSNGVLTYAYALSKRRNKELYDYLHSRYEVKIAMKKMLLFPRLSKRMVAIFYLIVGQKLFFFFIGLFFYLCRK